MPEQGIQGAQTSAAAAKADNAKVTWYKISAFASLLVSLKLKYLQAGLHFPRN